MATNREMLKEAIADAKAVKETAIANAKAALEEAFTPQLKTMFAAKLQEMESEEEDMNENYSEEMEESMDMEDMNEEEDMNEVDLEELLAELDEEDEIEESLNEAEEGEEDMEMDSEEDSDEEAEPIDLEDMTDEDLKSMIEDVIKDMIESGELEAGHEEGEEAEEEAGEENEEEEMDSEEEEIDLAELLREIEEMDEEMNPDLEEGIADLFKGVAAKFIKANKMEADKIIAMDDKKAALEAAESLIMKFRNEELDKGQTPDAVRANVSDLREKLGLSSLGGSSKSSVSISETEEELTEALSTIEILKSELNEINLLNAKLLYTNKIFKSKNLNENQKVKVLSSFDKATTVGEVKMVFETLNEGIKVTKTSYKENLGRASKGTITPTTKQPIVESNEAYLRMQKLAGII